jgi:hypothetical protein
MFSLPRRIRHTYAYLACLLVATVFLGAPAGLSGGHAKGIPQIDPWSVYKGGDTYSPPSCHQLSYFSRTLPSFDSTTQDPSRWPPGSFTDNTEVYPLGTIQKHRIYQVFRDIQPDPEKAPANAVEVGVKRIVVERRPDEFCMIFEEDGTLGDSGWIFRMEPATISLIDDVPVLLTYDRLEGNGGYTIDGAWILENGVPFSLLGPLNDSISRALKEILPPECGLRPSRNGLDLENLRFLAQLWPNTEGAGGSTCDGAVLLKLGVRNHMLVVVDKQLRP